MVAASISSYSLSSVFDVVFAAVLLTLAADSVCCLTLPILQYTAKCKYPHHAVSMHGLTSHMHMVLSSPVLLQLHLLYEQVSKVHALYVYSRNHILFAGFCTRWYFFLDRLLT